MIHLVLYLVLCTISLKCGKKVNSPRFIPRYLPCSKLKIGYTSSYGPSSYFPLIYLLPDMMTKFLHLTEVKQEFEERSLSNVAEYPNGITPANGKISVFKEDMTFDQIHLQTGFKVPSRNTMASYLDKF